MCRTSRLTFCGFTGPVSEDQCEDEAEDVEVDIEQCSDSESKCRSSRTKSNHTPVSDEERLSPEPILVSNSLISEVKIGKLKVSKSLCL
jgi:hypothetical protein